MRFSSPRIRAEWGGAEGRGLDLVGGGMKRLALRLRVVIESCWISAGRYWIRFAEMLSSTREVREDMEGGMYSILF